MVAVRFVQWHTNVKSCRGYDRISSGQLLVQSLELGAFDFFSLGKIPKKFAQRSQKVGLCYNGRDDDYLFLDTPYVSYVVNISAQYIG